MFRCKQVPVLALALLLALLCGGTGVALGVAPVVKGISPNNGSVTGGTQVTISGEGFIAGSTVKFGSQSAAAVRIVSSSQIKATSPLGTGLVGVSVVNTNGLSAATPYDQFGYDTAPTALWLGLNGNNSTYLGPVDYFSEREIVYDRGGPIEFTAGELPKGGVETDVEEGMIPVVVIEYESYDGQYKSDPEFPQKRTGKEIAEGKSTIKAYVHGFVKTAAAVLQEAANKNPEVPVLLEPMNEPWGYTTPQYNGAEYGEVIAELLPEAQKAGIPLADIYVGAIGKDGWVPSMYKAQAKLETEVQGWYFHPYGPPNGTHEENSEGIQSLPYVQAEMTSGQNNIIVSEVGYCAKDVNEGIGCNGTEESVTAATHLTEMLDNAQPYHEAGWLKALLVYSRNAGGWAMQTEPGVGALTKQGKALEAFAESQVGWSILETAQSKGSFSDVACSDPDSCLVIGTVPKVFGERWNGSKWTLEAVAPSEAITSYLSTVACASATACTIVGTYTTKDLQTKMLAEQWNGIKWQQHLMPALESTEPVAAVHGMSCSSPSACTVVGFRIPGKSVSPFVNRWNGAEWTSQSTPKIEGHSGGFEGVSCPSSMECTAVGSVQGKALIESWNGAEWQAKATQLPGNVTSSAFASVSCASSTACMAVGSGKVGAGPFMMLADRWDGSEWHPETLPDPLWAKSSSLDDISCTAATACMAVGSDSDGSNNLVTLVGVWNGTEWAVRPSLNINKSAFERVSCASVLECVAVGRPLLVEANY
jgi:hypothetical protein